MTLCTNDCGLTGERERQPVVVAGINPWAAYNARKGDGEVAVAFAAGWDAPSRPRVTPWSSKGRIETRTLRRLRDSGRKPSL